MFHIFELFSLYPTFFYTITFIISLMIGSFLNVVIHRLPIMMEKNWKAEFNSYFDNDDSTSSNTEPAFNLATPGSTCPKCGHKIKAWENIPLISWLIQRGKCTSCRAAISARYPLVELLTGLLSLVIAFHFGPTYACLAALILTWSLIALTFIDADTMLLPDQITLPLLWLGLLISIDSIFVTPTEAIIGATAGYLVLWSLFWGFKLLTGKEGMGYGDFKLLAALGAWVGWQHLAIIVILSSFVGAILGIIILSIKGKDKNIPIPFGPYLAIAGWLTFLYGDWIAQQYWGYVLG
ncbi:prepilin peptidase [Alteromonas sp. a30]|uniref:prepilin peptidase n=1 Tax=Alteromonas sp. a30 TaxID=2730917 RepID=UPI0022818FE0|nr:A24 family peptidase [Alteromonas sp. a30]MCY7294234.1 prepilin peptidase [Alteromonas sp. a30]